MHLSFIFISCYIIFLLNSSQIYHKKNNILLTEYLAVQDKFLNTVPSAVFLLLTLQSPPVLHFSLLEEMPGFPFPHFLVPSSSCLPFLAGMVGGLGPSKLSFSRPAAAMWLCCSAHGRRSVRLQKPEMWEFGRHLPQPH